MDKSKIAAQTERFRNGFPWLDIVAPATPDKGIEILSAAQAEAAAAYADSAEVKGKCKFVPASGAASRMFKDIFAGLSALENGTDPGGQEIVREGTCAGAVLFQ